MSDLEDFKLGHKHNAGDPEGRRVMTDKHHIASEPVATRMNWIEVTKHEFDAFLKAYPQALSRDITGICEPPLLSYNDFSNGRVWPESMVAKAVLGKPKQFFVTAHPPVPVAEPVAWRWKHDNGYTTDWRNMPVPSDGYEAGGMFEYAYAHPPVAPVASKSVEDCMRLACEFANDFAVNADWHPAKDMLRAAIVAYGDAQWNAGRDAAIKAIRGNSALSNYEARCLIETIRGLTR